MPSCAMRTAVGGVFLQLRSIHSIIMNECQEDMKFHYAYLCKA
jgi:hypothetical protein